MRVMVLRRRAFLGVGSVVMVGLLGAQDTPVLPLPFMPEDVARTHIIHYVAPVYPGAAERKCLSGSVVLELIVGEAGTVEHVTVQDGLPELTSAATDAAKQWMYEPFLINQRPTRYKTKATVRFRPPGATCIREAGA
jgi:TonB family protein